MEFSGVARSDRSIMVGSKGLMSARTLRVWFSAEVLDIPELVPGKLYTVSIEPKASEELLASIDEDLKGATKADLLGMISKLRKSELRELVVEVLASSAEDEDQEEQRGDDDGTEGTGTAAVVEEDAAPDGELPG